MRKLCGNIISHMICLISIITYTRSSDCEFHVEAIVRKGQAFEGNHFWTTKTSDVTECAVTCIRRKRCVAFNYNMDNGRCELSAENGLAIQVSRNTVYSRIDEWPSQVDQGCYYRPCGEDEVCIPGTLGNGQPCSYLCMEMFSRCPLVDGVKSNGPRTVGTTLDFTCEAGYRGGSSTKCLPSLQWSMPLDTTCTPIFHSICETTEECSDINGVCVESKCECPEDHEYVASEVKCRIDCGDWVRFENSCYKIETSKMNFEQAEAFCHESNAHLVQVDSRAEGEFLKRKLTEAIDTGNENSYWNDLYQFGDADHSEKWKTSGEELNGEADDWGGVEPNNAYEKCTVFFYRFYFKWADIPCDNAYRPICEKQ